MSPKKSYSIETEVVHYKSADQHNAAVAPLYQSATFKQPSVNNMGEYDYTRSGNPTRTQLQHILAKIMKADHAFAVSSGMSAVDVILKAFAEPGDEVVAGTDLYGGTDRLLTYLNKKGDAIARHYDTSDTDLIKSVIETSPNLKLIILESPTNPLMLVLDVRAIADYAHQVNPDIIVAVDNTMMSPLLMSPLDLGADIHFESGTKYLNGHHDIMAGVIATRSKELADKLYYVINSTGCGLSPFDCWLMQRGLKTLHVRMEKQQQNTMKIAEFLERLGFKVRYPGLKSHPQYKLHQELTGGAGAGAVLSFETGSTKILEKILEYTDIFGILVSFGCVNSLISMPCKMSHASIDADKQAERGLPQDLIRLSIGIESCADLIDDLNQAITRSLETDLQPKL
jgi:cystathionine beta-lyase